LLGPVAESHRLTTEVAIVADHFLLPSVMFLFSSLHEMMVMKRAIVINA